MKQYIADPTDYVCEKENFDGGTYGTISLVHHKDKPDHKIALKKIEADPDDSINNQYFIREVTSMAQINHPCVIELIGFFYSSKEFIYHIYTPFMPNNNLMTMLMQDLESTEKVLTPTIRTKLIYGIASGMTCLHLNNIVHRDLKPDNVFLDGNMEAIIGDLGFSRIFSELQMTIQLGSPYYMAPELFVGGEITKQIDVYAFAVVLLQFFSPILKFATRKNMNKKNFILWIRDGHRYIIPDDVPDFYVSLIKSCWDQDPHKRPSFPDILHLFEENDKFILDGADVKEVKNYIKKLNQYVADGKLTPCSSKSYSTETKEFDFNNFE